MLKQEENNVLSYLKTVLNKEEKLLDKRVKNFYSKYRINITPIFFSVMYKENFYLLLKYLDYGIYFNDIENSFGICKIKDNKCVKYAEFFDSLNATLIKFQELLSNHKLEKVLEE